MPVDYTSREGKTFRLMVGRERTGKPNYFMAMVEKAANVKGEPAEAVPEGFEIYEDPQTARVSLRRQRPTTIAPVERAYVEEVLRRLTDLEHFFVRSEGNCIVVYVSDLFGREEWDCEQITEEWGPRAVDYFARRRPYSSRLRLELVDDDRRIFAAPRWNQHGELPRLVEELAPRLSKETLSAPKW